MPKARLYAACWGQKIEIHMECSFWCGTLMLQKQLHAKGAVVCSALRYIVSTHTKCAILCGTLWLKNWNKHGMCCFLWHAGAINYKYVQRALFHAAFWGHKIKIYAECAVVCGTIRLKNWNTHGMCSLMWHAGAKKYKYMQKAAPHAAHWG